MNVSDNWTYNYDIYLYVFQDEWKYSENSGQNTRYWWRWVEEDKEGQQVLTEMMSLSDSILIWKETIMI